MKRALESVAATLSGESGMVIFEEILWPEDC